MGRIVLFPYKLASASSRSIANALKRNGKDAIRVYPDRSYRPRPDDIIINWGNSHEPVWKYSPEQMCNLPASVGVAVNKLETLKALKEWGVRTVPWTQNKDEARAWGLVCERHTLTGHSGEGIRVSTPDMIQNAPLYTEMLVPCDEYRVHVFNGQIIDYSKKVKEVNGEFVSAPEELIKNKEHDWYFLRDVAPRDSVQEAARTAVEALGLDFGAVDIIRYKKKAYVLEVGTAAGLSPVGVEAYTNAIIEYAE